MAKDDIFSEVSDCKQKTLLKSVEIFGVVCKISASYIQVLVQLFLVVLAIMLAVTGAKSRTIQKCNGLIVLMLLC